MSPSGDGSDRWLTVLDGSTFFVSDRAGDIEAADAATGFFFEDTRHISAWRLLADGRPISVLTSRPIHHYSARIYGTLALVGVGKNPSLTIRRDRAIADGLHEDVVVDNNSHDQQQVRLELVFDADFADLFEVKDGHVPGRHVDREVSNGQVLLRYQSEGFSRTTSIAFSLPGLIEPTHAVFELDLAPRQRWELCVHVTLGTDDGEAQTHAHHGSVEAVQPNLPRTLDEWLADAPRLETSLDALRHTYQQSLLDLAALRIRPTKDVAWSLPAGGLPWSMALFWPRQPDHVLPGATIRAAACPNDPRGTRVDAGPPVRRLPRRRAREDPARAALRRADPPRRVPTQPLLRQSRCHPALPDTPRRVRALERRPRARAPAGTACAGCP